MINYRDIMHEVSVIEEIIEVVNDQIREYPGKKVQSITLKIGKFRNYVPDIMRFSWESMTKDTDLDGASLRIIEIPVELKCRDCKHVYQPEEYDFICPKCDSTHVDMNTGDELLLDSLELIDIQ